MERKRITDRFPFLLPVRKKQRCFCFYTGMALDKEKYAKTKDIGLLPYEVMSTSSKVINEASGFNIEYQYNKAHNLALASEPVNGVLIRPGETFSFWQLVRHAEKNGSYKEALSLLHGQMSTAKGGGLCQLSNTLFWLFLHTPLTIVERHPHSTEFFATETDEVPHGADATISEGWLDLKVKNETENTFQILMRIEDGCLSGSILSLDPLPHCYKVYGSRLQYYSKGENVYRENDVCRKTIEKKSGMVVEDRCLYHSRSVIKYPLEEDMAILENRDEDADRDRQKKKGDHHEEKKRGNHVRRLLRRV